MPRLVRALLVVFLGGVIGTGIRYGVVELVDAQRGSAVLALLIVNLIGSFALGWFAGRDPFTPRPALVRLLVGAGILASLTTFSGVMVETVELVRADQSMEALALLIASIGGGVAVAAAGRRLAAP